ncbi:hypothetical protein TH61_03655 [Rufibacter sp. DG15C]|uniref:hypothetical protein n=1 Tax=Rufibacter sp. DG15C TaxID=1379909 RepID=UPI00078E4F8C|nr:hypothetical protein [Rufibacter sp. DG15C]AMM50460.1 hypothetical protein TH61_03655 [Rufibacter sp. DG15C]
MIRIVTISLCATLLISCSSTVQHTGQAPENFEQSIINSKQSFYTQISLDTLTNASYKDFSVNEAYRYKNYKLLFGAFDSQIGELSPNESESDIGVRLLVLDQADQLVFRSKGQGDSYILRPKFYALNAQSPLLVFAEIGTEYSWGNIVFSLNENGIKEIGEIDVAGIDLALDDYDDVSNVIKIEKTGSNLKFSFDADSVVLNPGGNNEQVVEAKGYFYLYNGKDFILVKK